MKPLKSIAPRRQVNGFSLIEVLVAVIVLSVGVLGVAAVQTSSLKFTQISQQRSVATQQAMDFTERMRSNLAGVRAGNYGFVFTYGTIPANTPGAVNCAGTCSALQIAQRDLNLWQTQLAAALPGGRGIVTGAAGNTFQVTVMWEEKDLSEGMTAVCPTVAATPAEVQCVGVRFQP